MAGGRPTKYTPELAQEICRGIATSSRGLTTLCKQNPHWPERTTIFQWRLDNEEFSNQYVKARQEQVEAFIDDISEIADDSSRDDVINDNGTESFNAEWAARSRIRIDTRKWIACKLAPKIYGDKVHHTADIKMTHEEQLKELE